MSTAWSRRRTSCSAAKTSASRTSSPSTCGRRERRPFAACSPRNGSLLFLDDGVSDAVAGAGLAGEHHHHLDQVPPRNQQGEVAYDRSSPAAALAAGGQQAQAEELFAEGAAAETIADDHPNHQDADRDGPDDRDR